MRDAGALKAPKVKKIPDKEVMHMPGMNDALSYIFLGIFVFAVIVFAMMTAG